MNTPYPNSFMESVMSNTVQKEAVGLMLVMADLTKQGAHVYIPVSDKAPCDCIAVFPKGILRVEIKGTSDPSNGVPKGKPENYDVLAAVNLVTETLIDYRPNIEEALSQVQYLSRAEKDLLTAARKI